MKQKFIRFMQGRYGADEFSRFLTYFALVMLILSIFSKFSILWYVGLAAIVYSYYRMFSKNIPKRYAENQKYLNIKDRVIRFFKGQKNLASQRKTHHIYTCPNCKQKIRIPKGKGKIEITCPKCKTTFIKRS